MTNQENQPVKSQFNSPAGHLYQAFWNGKTYSNGNQYLSFHGVPNGKDVKAVVNAGRVIDFNPSYGKEIAEAAAKAVGLL